MGELTISVLQEDRRLIENTVYERVLEVAAKYDTKSRPVPHHFAEDIGLAVGQKFVEWAMVQKGAMRDADKNEAKGGG